MMKNNWGETPVSVIYDTNLLLSFIHEYMGIDPNSKAYSLLHELFMLSAPDNVSFRVEMDTREH